MRLLGGQHFDHIAVSQRIVDGCNAAVDLTSGHAVADGGMNAIGKVNRCSTERQADGVATRRKDKHFIRKQINLDVFDKVLSFCILLCLQQLPNPRIRLLAAALLQVLLILPMRRNAVFCHLVHFFRADLYFKRHTGTADNRCVQRAIAVRLWRRNIVFKTSRNRFVQIVYIAQHIVTVRHRLYDDTNGANVINLIDALVLFEHLAINAVNMLYTGRNRIFDAALVQLSINGLFDAVEHFFQLRTLTLQTIHNFLVSDRIEIFQRQILQLPFDALHAQAVCNRRINLHGLQRLGALFFHLHVLHGAHIVQAVCQFNQNDADILRHRNQHLAQIFDLLLFLGIVQPAQSCDAIDQISDRFAELLLNLVIPKCGVLNAIMQQTCTNRIGIQSHLYNDFRNRDRMNNIWITIFPLLSIVCLVGALICATNFIHIRIRRLLLYTL